MKVLYGLSSLALATWMLALMLLAIELGYRIGCGHRAAADESLKEQTRAIDAAIVGMLSLLLGFTFTMALQHYDARHHAMIEEANAIGTTWFRADLVPAPHGENARALLREYLDLRLQAGEADLTRAHPFEELAARTARLQEKVWAEAVGAARQDPGPVTAGLFAQAVNDMVDAQAERNAALERHVPEYIVLLLTAVGIASAFVTGYSAGLGGQRPAMGTAALSLLVALVVFMIADLDRPRRGLVQAGHENLIELRAAVNGVPH